jgi:hypothetical protein
MIPEVYPPMFIPKLYTMLQRAIGLDISIYVKGVPDAMMDGTLVDFDEDFIYMQTPDSAECWRIDSLSGLVVLTPENDPKFEVIFKK